MTRLQASRTRALSSGSQPLASLCLCLLALLVRQGWAGTVMTHSLEKDLVKLSRTLPGVYTNSRQYLEEANMNLSVSRRHVLQRSVFRPVRLGVLKDAFNVYFEQYNGDDSAPYRQRVFSFTVDNSQRAIRMRTFRFVEDGLAREVASHFRKLRHIKTWALAGQEECDMLWRRLSRTTFVATTGRSCLGNVQGVKVRISVSMTLTPNSIQTHEGWYKVKDGAKIVEIEVPNNMLKTKTFKGKKYVPKSIRRGKSKRGKGKGKRKRKGSFKHRNSQKDSAATREHDVNSIASIPPSGSAWNLMDFSTLVDALTSGRAVYFVMDLGGCSLPAQAKVERLTFGDYVDFFEYFRNQEEQKDYVKFTHRKLSQTDKGVVWVDREISVFPNGKVKVRIRVRDEDADSPSATYAAYCRMFNYDTLSGDVKFTTDPLRNIRDIRTFSLLRSSLKRGRRVRMTSDLAKCSSAPGSQMLLIGGEIRAYDFVDGGKTIEFTMSVANIDGLRDGSSTRFVIGRFFSSGDVIFMDTTNQHQNSYARVDTVHRCSLSGESPQRNKGENSVSLFYM